MTRQLIWSRRAILRLAWAGAVAAGALTVRPLAQYLTSEEDQPRSPLVYVAEIPEENADWLQVPGSRVWLKRDGQGIMALAATCTHLGCEVNYHRDQREWRCPCHGSIYDAEGRPISGPAPQALPRVAVERKADGSLIINTAKQVGLDERV
ncbi:ubiquinol-cytochrome c reductase iron-sulfur subunit [Desulfosporosinus sp. PR]|uniref:QcrA and Rieske domain-containing protein n=1 Tax=Candidatus Desulfosporosinus nitrosoreducens TaxID=3401928 RepID=UPI0027F38039|nr:ubiquinol-cytochrome c reductase iron-sulfur subunit [Desulfosporosinus sp. PR]MDQ7095884.1 ubiquinol-cytochrome c reductase iron-sulfur subunit [Desulfosporosinus sp. PR]